MSENTIHYSKSDCCNAQAEYMKSNTAEYEGLVCTKCRCSCGIRNDLRSACCDSVVDEVRVLVRPSTSYYVTEYVCEECGDFCALRDTDVERDR